MPDYSTSTVSLWIGWALLEERCGQAALAREHFREALKRDRFAVDVSLAPSRWGWKCGGVACVVWCCGVVVCWVLSGGIEWLALPLLPWRSGFLYGGLSVWVADADALQRTSDMSSDG